MVRTGAPYVSRLDSEGARRAAKRTTMSDAETETLAYLRAASDATGMNVSDARLPEVYGAFARIAAFARDIEALPLPATVEPAVRFEP